MDGVSSSLPPTARLPLTLLPPIPASFPNAKSKNPPPPPPPGAPPVGFLSSRTAPGVGAGRFSPNPTALAVALATLSSLPPVPVRLLVRRFRASLDPDSSLPAAATASAAARPRFSSTNGIEGSTGVIPVGSRESVRSASRTIGSARTSESDTTTRSPPPPPLPLPLPEVWWWCFRLDVVVALFPPPPAPLYLGALEMDSPFLLVSVVSSFLGLPGGA